MSGIVLKGWGERRILSRVCRNNSGEEERGKKRELKEADNWQIRRTGTNKAGGQAQANETIIPKHGENVSDNVAGNVGV